jgi:hypothetical protein
MGISTNYMDSHVINIDFHIVYSDFLFIYLLYHFYKTYFSIK